jgi:tetratricopeptide (TPR) repeat protein
MPDRPTLAVCMIARNEGARLPGAIESVRKIADRVIVVDTGSTDDTIEQARSLGAQVVEYTWQDDFAEARNRSLAEAECDWILCLDADECLAPESESGLLQVLSGKAGAYMVRIESRVDSTAGKVFVNFFPRLFRNLEGVRFEGKVHEQVTPSLERLGVPIEISDIVIRHTGYALSDSDMTAKAQRNADLLLQEVEERPKDALALFHLGEAYSMMGRYKDAVEAYDRALAAGIPDRVVRAALLQNKGTALVKLKEYEKAIVSLKQAREVDPGLLTVHLVLASALYGMKKFKRAEQEVISYISMCREIERVKRVTLGHDPDIPNGLVMLAKCRVAQGQPAGARQALEDALRMDRSNGDAHVLMGKIAFEELKFGQAAKHFEEAISAYPDEERLRFELARAYVACGSNDKAIRALDSAIENGMHAPDLLRCLGVLKIKKKDFTGAIEAYRRALGVDPGDSDSRKKLAGLYHASGNTDLAKELLAGSVTSSLP